MSQYDFGTIDPNTKSGTALAADLNSWRTALHSMHSGATAPSYVTAGMLWVDTTSANYILKIYDGTDWISLAQINAASNIWGVPAQNFTVDTNVLFVDATNDRVGSGTSSPAFPFHLVNANAGILARIESTTGMAQMDLYNSVNGQVNGAENGRIRWVGKNSVNTAVVYGAIHTTIIDVTSGSEDGRITIAATGAAGEILLSSKANFTGGLQINGTSITATAAEINALSGITATVADLNRTANILAGTYTPTLTNVANVDSSTAFACGYSRNGDFVTVEGQITIDATAAATDTEVGISLPIASNFAGAQQCAGVGACIAAGAYGESAAVSGDVTNDRARFLLRPSAATARNYAFHFSYRII